MVAAVAAEFIAYIDESGDEGFKAGASEWFVLSAIIVAKADDPGLVQLLDGVRVTLGREPRTALHFRDLKHPQRLPYVDAIAGAPLVAATVLVHKPSMAHPENFKAPHRLYFYTTRYLLERVSWYVRDHREGGRHGAGHAEIVFSNRSSMSYEDLRNYFSWLKALAEGGRQGINIAWTAIKSDDIRAFGPMKRAGLIVADAVASSFFYAVEPMLAGYTEDRYATMLKPAVYRYGPRYVGYGVKLVPSDAQAAFEANPHLEWIRRDYA